MLDAFDTADVGLIGPFGSAVIGVRSLRFIGSTRADGKVRPARHSPMIWTATLLPALWSFGYSDLFCSVAFLPVIVAIAGQASACRSIVEVPHEFQPCVSD